MISVSTVTTGHKDVLKALDFLKRLNINNIELGAFHEPVKDIGKVIQFRKDNSTAFTVHAFFPPVTPPLMLNFASSDPILMKRYIDFAKHAIEFCRKIDALIYSVHSGYDTEVDSQATPLSEDRISFEQVLKNNTASLLEITDYARNYGLKIAFENHSSYTDIKPFSTPEELLRLLKAVNAKNLGFLIDIGHLNVASKKLNFDFKEALDKLKDHIFEFHIHHNDGTYDQHLPLPDDSLIRHIPKELSKKAVFTLEGKEWSPEDILKSREILRSSF